MLHYAISGRGGSYRIGDELVAAMAICRYDDSGALYLFKCAADWDVIQDADWESVEDAMRTATEHAGPEAPLRWVRVAEG